MALNRKQLESLNNEIATVTRLRGIGVETVLRSMIEFLDYEYHGVVPLPLPDTEQPEGRGLEE